MKKPISIIIAYLLTILGLTALIMQFNSNILRNTFQISHIYLDPLPLPTSPYFHKSEFFEKNQTYNYVFMGSSHSYRSLSPAIFGDAKLTAYNLGSPSQTPVITSTILPKVVGRTEYIIMEIYPYVFGLDGNESFLGLLSVHYPESILRSIVFDYLDIDKTMAYLLNPLKKVSYINDKEFAERFHNGYLETKSTAPHNQIYNDIKIENGPTLEKNLKAVEKISEIARRNNIKLIFVSAPLPTKLIIHSGDLVYSRVEQIAKTNQIPFFNWSRNHNFDDRKDFADSDHLNNKGVQKFNEMLLNKLKDL